MKTTARFTRERELVQDVGLVRKRDLKSKIPKNLRCQKANTTNLIKNVFFVYPVSENSSSNFCIQIIIIIKRVPRAGT